MLPAAHHSFRQREHVDGLISVPGSLRQRYFHDKDKKIYIYVLIIYVKKVLFLQDEKHKQEGRKRKMNRLEDTVIITTSHIVHTRIMMCQSNERV